MWDGQMMQWGGGWGWGLFGFLHMFLWWILIILGIVVLARWLGSSGPRHGSRDSALDILRERYARGEIDKAEFEARKRDLAA